MTHHSAAEREDRVGQNKHHHRHGTMLLTRNRAKAENGGGAESQAVESHGWFRGGEWKVVEIKKMSLLCVTKKALAQSVRPSPRRRQPSHRQSPGPFAPAHSQGLPSPPPARPLHSPQPHSYYVGLAFLVPDTRRSGRSMHNGRS